MFHRRGVDDVKKNDDVGRDIPNGSSSPPPVVVNKKIRRRRSKGGQKSAILLLKQIIQTFADEDLVISLIQVTSALILVGCGITLTAHWFGDTMRLATHIPGQPYPLVPLRPSRYYTIPNTMNHIGDKSDSYALLRKDIDAKMSTLSHSEIFTKEKYHLFDFQPMPMIEAEPNDPQPLEQVPYDIYNCPDEPPIGYPFAWTLKSVLNHWGPDDTNPPPSGKIHQGLCVFDYQKDYDKAIRYRKQELPFVIQNDPQVHNAVYRWNQPNYLNQMLGPSVKHRAEYSESNHFLYWQPPPKKRPGAEKAAAQRAAEGLPPKKKKPWQSPAIEQPKDWKEPTEMMRMTYSDWLSHANVTDDGTIFGPDQPHWYFRLIGCGETGPQGQCDAGSSEYLFDELTFFQPKDSLYIVKPDQQKGIHCRFGMRGVIAENHFDGSRNMIAVMGGARRYVLSHPNQCPYLSLLPKGHPSARHSAVDWSDPDYDKYPEFALAKGNEVVLQAGDVLYLPTNWFHYIVSLTLNFQCNTRSGITQDYMPPIRECGF